MSQLILNEQLSDQAPSEILVIKFGKTNTRKGAYLFDKGAAKQVMDLYLERNLDLYFDYNHLSMDPEDAEQGIAAGWYKLEVREDGLWAVDIKWTDKAKGLIEAKEYRYISPVIITDKDTKVVRLINIALTNLPATDDLIPLISLEEKELAEKYSGINFKPNAGVRSACKRGLKYHEEGKSGDGLMPATVSWARKLAGGGAWTPEKAVKARAWFERHESDKSGKDWNKPSAGKVAWLLWGGDAGRSQVKKIVAQMEKADNASKKNSEEVKLVEGEPMQDKMKHLKHLDESMDYLTAYSMHVAKAMLMVDDKDMDGDSDKDIDQDGMREMYKDHMDTLMEMADCVKAQRLTLDPLQTYVKKEDMFYTLGQLSEKIVEKEEIIKIEMEVPAMLTEQVINMTGKTELNEQLGVLMALKDNVSRLSEQNTSLLAEVKALKEKALDSEKTLLVEDAIKAKKLLPSQKAWALGAPIDLIKSYLAVTPVLLSTKMVRESEIPAADILNPNAQYLVDKLERDIKKLNNSSSKDVALTLE